MTRALLVLCALCACEARPPVREPLPSGNGPFIALGRDFARFRSWQTFDLRDRPAQGLTHTGGNRRLFISALPPTGSAAFPTGTMIVKELQGGTKTGHSLFAMVKRGPGFNARGARGWEWFELREAAQGEVLVAWRGLDAPTGEAYGGGSAGEADPLGGCNGCHGIAQSNDYVKADELLLAKVSAKAR